MLLPLLYSVHTSPWLPSSGDTGVQLYTGKANKKPKKTYIDNNSSTRFNNLQHYNNYLIGHSDINSSQPICHYAAPLLGGIKTNAT